MSPLIFNVVFGIKLIGYFRKRFRSKLYVEKNKQKVKNTTMKNNSIIFVIISCLLLIFCKEIVGQYGMGMGYYPPYGYGGMGGMFGRPGGYPMYGYYPQYPMYGAYPCFTSIYCGGYGGYPFYGNGFSK